MLHTICDFKKSCFLKSSSSAVSLRWTTVSPGLHILFTFFIKSQKELLEDFFGQNLMCFLLCQMHWHISPFLLLSVQKPGMQGVPISNGGQQMDACAGTNGGVHAVVQHPQAAAVALHSGGQEQVSCCWACKGNCHILDWSDWII